MSAARTSTARTSAAGTSTAAAATLLVGDRVHDDYLGDGTVQATPSAGKAVGLVMVAWDEAPPFAYNCGENPAVVWANQLVRASADQPATQPTQPATDRLRFYVGGPDGIRPTLAYLPVQESLQSLEDRVRTNWAQLARLIADQQWPMGTRLVIYDSNGRESQSVMRAADAPCADALPADALPVGTLPADALPAKALPAKALHADALHVGTRERVWGPTTEAEARSPEYHRGECPLCDLPVVTVGEYVTGRGYLVWWHCWGGLTDPATCDYYRFL